jgi:hypothetical protein
MNIDIQAIVNDHIKAMEEKGIIEKTIQETLEKSILGAITSALESYKLRNTIEEKVSKEVSVVAADIGFTAYNSFIAEKIKAITEGVYNADIAAKIQKTFDEILVIKRESIKLSEIFDKYREWVNQYVDEDEKHDLECFHVKFEKDEHYGWINIELAQEKPDTYSSERGMIKFTIHKNSDKKGYGIIFSVFIDGYDITKNFSFRLMSEFELLLINITYNQTPIEIDIENEDDIDNSYDVDD